MSSALAMAAVTHVLKDLLNEGIINHVLIGDVRVTAQPPIREPKPAGTGDSQLNVFLYQATPNVGWRNRGLPSFDGAGNRTGNPPLALDLHYMVTAYDERDLHAEVLLGYAMQLLHENPVLPRALIRRSLTSDIPPAPGPSPPNPPSLPPELRALTRSGLADQIETIKITLQTLNAEEMSKLWTGFQAPYRPSAAYLATVVLIESELPARAAPPVLTRGGLVPPVLVPGGDPQREEGVRLQTHSVPPLPALDELVLPQQIAIRLGETLTFRGHHLAGTAVRVRFRLLSGDSVLELSAPPGATASGFDLPLLPDPPPGPPPPPPPAGSPLNPDNWQAGIYEVSVIVEVNGIERVTNRLPLVLAPRITVVRQPASGPLVTLEVTCHPRIKGGQRVALVVGDRELAPNPFTAPTANLVFQAPGAANRLPNGTLPVRLRVDGIESLVVDRQATPPRFAQTVLVS